MYFHTIYIRTRDFQTYDPFVRFLRSDGTAHDDDRVTLHEIRSDKGIFNLFVMDRILKHEDSYRTSNKNWFCF